MTSSDAPPPPRHVIVGGGTPSPEQVAALVVALTPTAGTADEGADRANGRVGGWALAALHEATGDVAFASAPQVAAARR